MNPFLIALLFLFGSPALALAPRESGFTDNYQAPAPHTYRNHQQQVPQNVTQASQVSLPPQPTQQTPLPSQSTLYAPQPSGTFASQVAADVFADTNQQRQQNGLAPLVLNATLASIAQTHSSDMLANNYFSHNDLQGCSPSCRLSNAGYPWQAMGENIYEMSGYNLDAAGTANQIVQGWMNSPEHRANILNTSYTQTGVGIAAQGSTVYATSDYAEPQSN